MARTRERGWPGDDEPLPSPVVDNHTHLDSVVGWQADGWPDDVPADLAAHLARARRAGIGRMVHVACDLDALDRVGPMVGEHPELLAAVAVHPNEAVLHAGVREVAPDGLDPTPEPRHEVPLDEAVAAVERLARGNDRVRAIGETGLDFFRGGPAGRAVQRAAFRDHIALAKQLGLVLQIHDRDAHAEVVEVLLADGAPQRTVFHCFAGDVELAAICAEHGWYASFAGPLTFRANDGLRAAAALMPAPLLQVETDAPYLTPMPYRGRPNAPYLMGGTVRELARVRDVDLGALCARLSETSEQLYGPW